MMILIGREVMKRRAKSKREKEMNALNGNGEVDVKAEKKPRRKLVNSLVEHLGPSHSSKSEARAQSLLASPVTPVSPDGKSYLVSPVATTPSTVDVFEMDSGCYELPTPATPATVEVFEMDGDPSGTPVSKKETDGVCYELPDSSIAILGEICELDGNDWVLPVEENDGYLAPSEDQGCSDPLVPAPLRLRKRDDTIENDKTEEGAWSSAPSQPQNEVLDQGGIPIPAAGTGSHCQPKSGWGASNYDMDEAYGVSY
jgi:hypothetical protein